MKSSKSGNSWPLRIGREEIRGPRGTHISSISLPLRHDKENIELGLKIDEREILANWEIKEE